LSPPAIIEQFRAVTEVAVNSKDYVTGMGRGNEWANVFLRRKGEAPLFCLPPKMHFDAPIIASLLDQEIRDPSSGVAWKPDTPIELIMVVLTERFPCKK
jgi:hypothetical protein